MEFLPTTMGTRPRLAVEVRPEGIVAGRSEAGSGVLAAVSRVDLSEGAVTPGLKSGNIVDRSLTASAVRRAVEATGQERRAGEVRDAHRAGRRGTRSSAGL